MADQQHNGFGRREFLKTAGAGAVAAALGAPEVTWAKSDNPIKIGVVEPITGTYAALGASQILGAKLAAQQINRAGGIMGRPLQLLIQDSESLPGPSVDKAARLLSQDKVDFLQGTVNSASGLALAQFAKQHDKLFVCAGSHADSITGSDCNSHTFRTCSTTWMLTAGNFDLLFKKFGKKWYFITPDYAFGHALQTDYTEQLKKAGGTVVGAALTPLGTTDFTSYLINAKGQSPDVLVLLLAGNDMVNCLKQITQFGLNKQMAVSGAMMDLETLQALPDDARYGWWTFEWYWNQPGNQHAANFVKEYRKISGGNTPSARSWFGFASTHAIALAAAKAKSTDTGRVIKAMENLVLPPEVACQPGNPMYRAGDHQLMLSMFPGHVIEHGQYPSLFAPADVVPGAKIAVPVAATGCHI